MKNRWSLDELESGYLSFKSESNPFLLGFIRFEYSPLKKIKIKMK
jgi:hypothetical protein